jgi:hypothetical protein
MWQGQSVIEADTIELDNPSQILVARGQVRGVFPRRRGVRKPGADQGIFGKRRSESPKSARHKMAPANAAGACAGRHADVLGNGIARQDRTERQGRFLSKARSKPTKSTYIFPTSVPQMQPNSSRAVAIGDVPSIRRTAGEPRIGPNTRLRKASLFFPRGNQPYIAQLATPPPGVN